MTIEYRNESQRPSSIPFSLPPPRDSRQNEFHHRRLLIPGAAFFFDNALACHKYDSHKIRPVTFHGFSPCCRPPRARTVIPLRVAQLTTIYAAPLGINPRAIDTGLNS